MENSAILRKIYEHVGQPIKEKGIAVDALSGYELQIIYGSNEGIRALLYLHEWVSPLRKRINSDFKTLHPFPALVAFMRPLRMYLKKVGLVILRYWHDSSVVRTRSSSR